MYHLFGKENSIRNVYRLSKKHLNGQDVTVNKLKSAFWQFLDGYQPLIPHPTSNRGFFVNDAEVEEKLTEAYRTDAILNDRSQSTLIAEPFDQETKLENEREATQAIEMIRNASQGIYQLLDLAIHSIFFRKSDSSGGGSTSNAIGVIWLNNRSHWSTQDLAELLIHELTHNLVFIDELCNLHMQDYALLQKEENFAQSAILHTKRPLDKVFHSIVVAVEVLKSRQNYWDEPKAPKVHPPSKVMYKQTCDALDSCLALTISTLC